MMKTALAVFVVFASSCAAQTNGILAARVTHDPVFKQAESHIWNHCYEQPGAPLVRYLSGADLTCTPPGGDEPGFYCPTVGCREGCTGIESIVALHGEPPSKTALPHELRHQWQTLHGIIDRNHLRDDWKPGGAVDVCISDLARRGL